MRSSVSPTAQKQLDKAPDNVQRAFLKQLRLLVADRNHPSLNTKKYGEVFQARIDIHWRFYFEIRGDVYLITAVTKHPK
jgi:mRNA-degrading endonuclease RelE of RelBE toxin-antitoxin system